MMMLLLFFLIIHRFEVTKNIDGKIAKLTILDTAGQEQYSSLLTDTMHNAEGFMLVFSVTDPDSFTKLNEVEKKVKMIKESMKEVPVILVANKIDLPRKITTEQGQEMAARFNCPYIETSAKTRHNIDEAFAKIVGEVRRIKNGPPPPTSGTNTPTSGDEKKGGKKKGCELQ
jgi:small GTP-binding protein